MFMILPPPLWVRPRTSLTLVDATAFTASSGAAYSGGVFAGKTFGAPKADRRLIAMLGGRSTALRTITAVTIGGVSASLVPGTNINQAADFAEMWQALVPLGTTGDITVTLSASAENIGIALYRMVDYDSIAPVSAGTSSGDASPVNVNILSGGVALAYSLMLQSGVQNNAWTGVNEEGDINTDSSQNTSHTFGSYLGTGPETPRAIVCDNPNNPAAANMVTIAASFR